MTTNIQRRSGPRVFLCALIGLLGIGAQRLLGAPDAQSADNAYLDALQGDWEMSGTLLGKPVKYHARGERVLQGGFLRLHMVDAGAVPT